MTVCRVSQQALRHTRLQTRWGQMQKELQTISKMREQKQMEPTRNIIVSYIIINGLIIYFLKMIRLC